MKLFRGQPDNFRWKPSRKDVAFVWLGLGIIALILAAQEYTSPSQSPSAGKLAWLRDIFIESFGSNGGLVMYSSFGVLFISYGIIKFFVSKKTG